MPLYHHTQIGYVTIIITVICLCVILILPVGNVPPYTIPLALLVLFIMLGLFASLTVEVNNEYLKFHFGIGLIHKRIRLSDIASCTSSRILIPSYGIHLTHRGWLYNVSGFKVVEIKLKDGKQFLLGTNEAEDLSLTITKTLALREGSTTGHSYST